MSNEDYQVRNVMSVERVAAYIRVSTQEQHLHGISLDAQIQKIQEYADKHNMIIVEWYKDEGVSGRKLIKKRPELQRMIQDAEKGMFERILFIKIDRFFRSVAEYHECMKRIAPVVWTTTEEEYDLTTANGRMLVNMKLTIAEMEADQTGERIKIVNEYKASTGQPLVGTQCLPFGFKVGLDTKTGRKNVIKDPDEAPIVEELINYFMSGQSKRKTIMYAYSKYHLSLTTQQLQKLFNNPMLHGEYRGNPDYCEPYIDKRTHEELIELNNSKNLKDNTATGRVYLFSGLIRCPECGRSMSGGPGNNRNRQGKVYIYKKYRCSKAFLSKGKCDNRKALNEKTIENILLENLDDILKNYQEGFSAMPDQSKKVYLYNIEEIQQEIDRLNYSWRKGMIRTVEQYEKDHEDLMEQLRLAEAERGADVPRDYSEALEVLSGNWKESYQILDDEEKRAFWRSVIDYVVPDWSGNVKKLKHIEIKPNML